MRRERVGLNFKERPDTLIYRVGFHRQLQQGGSINGGDRAALWRIQMEQEAAGFLRSGEGAGEVQELPQLQHGGPQAKDILPNPASPRAFAERGMIKEGEGQAVGNEGGLGYAKPGREWMLAGDQSDGSIRKASGTTHQRL